MKGTLSLIAASSLLLGASAFAGGTYTAPASHSHHAFVEAAYVYGNITKDSTSDTAESGLGVTFGFNVTDKTDFTMGFDRTKAKAGDYSFNLGHFGLRHAVWSMDSFNVGVNVGMIGLVFMPYAGLTVTYDLTDEFYAIGEANYVFDTATNSTTDLWTASIGLGWVFD